MNTLAINAYNLVVYEGQSKGLTFTQGQHLAGKVVEVLDEEHAIIDINGQKVIAETKVPLTQGQQIIVEVKGKLEGRFHLQMVEADSELDNRRIPYDRLQQVLKVAGLPVSRGNMQLVESLLQYNVSPSPQNLKIAVSMNNLLDVFSDENNVVAKILAGNLPLEPEVILVSKLINETTSQSTGSQVLLNQKISAPPQPQGQALYQHDKQATFEQPVIHPKEQLSFEQADPHPKNQAQTLLTEQVAVYPKEQLSLHPREQASFQLKENDLFLSEKQTSFGPDGKIITEHTAATALSSTRDQAYGLELGQALRSNSDAYNLNSQVEDQVGIEQVKTSLDQRMHDFSRASIPMNLTAEKFEVRESESWLINLGDAISKLMKIAPTLSRVEGDTSQGGLSAFYRLVVDVSRYLKGELNQDQVLSSLAKAEQLIPQLVARLETGSENIAQQLSNIHSQWIVKGTISEIMKAVNLEQKSGEMPADLKMESLVPQVADKDGNLQLQRGVKDLVKSLGIGNLAPDENVVGFELEALGGLSEIEESMNSSNNVSKMDLLGKGLIREVQKLIEELNSHIGNKEQDKVTQISSLQNQFETAVSELHNHLNSVKAIQQNPFFREAESFVYLPLPLLINGQTHVGELYAWKNPQKGKSQIDQGFYLVMVLQTQNIGKFNIHLESRKEELELRFFVDNYKAQRLVDESRARLAASIENNGFVVKKLSCQLEPKSSKVVQTINQKLDFPKSGLDISV